MIKALQSADCGIITRKRKPKDIGLRFLFADSLFHPGLRENSSDDHQTRSTESRRRCRLLPARDVPAPARSIRCRTIRALRTARSLLAGIFASSHHERPAKDCPNTGFSRILRLPIVANELPLERRRKGSLNTVTYIKRSAADGRDATDNGTTITTVDDV